MDATIQEDRPDDTPVNGITGCGIGVARKDFLFALGEKEVAESLYLGRVFSEGRGLLEEWVTFHGKHRIFVRGSENAQYRQCIKCGKHLYFALGRHYLYPRPSLAVAIFDKGNGGLVVTKALAQRITVNKWRKLVCESLAVLDPPLDGFASLPAP